MRYRIRDWKKHFENHASKKLKRLDWVALPVKMDGEGFTFLATHPNGAAHFGGWVAIVQIAARQRERGTLPSGIGGTCETLSRISRFPSGVFEELIPRLLQLEWIEQVQSDEQDTAISADSADASADSADASGDRGKKAAHITGH